MSPVWLWLLGVYICGGDILDSIWNFMVKSVAELLNNILSLLPRSPFADFIQNFSFDSSLRLYLGWLNWFFPIRNIITIFSLWISAYALFLLYSIILRWVKVIGD